MVIKFPGDERPRDKCDGSLLTEPRQGFKSLTRELWPAYTLARRLGMPDLGTHNPSSTLPGGGKSDHAYSPARAFDVGLAKARGGETGREVTRWFFRRMIGRPEVEYVIFEQKIWSQSNGLRTYTAGGHETHVHVSARHVAT